MPFLRFLKLPLQVSITFLRYLKLLLQVLIPFLRYLKLLLQVLMPFLRYLKAASAGPHAVSAVLESCFCRSSCPASAGLNARCCGT
ncbi:hypothetical protein BDR07DRAFT_842423 [Suillus spraguei]|nr:hypothetical protein BDR07DRAFT_842423 [Suillus spraguei]